MSPSLWPVVIFNQRANGPSRARSAPVVLLLWISPPVSQRGRSTPPPLSGWDGGGGPARALRCHGARGPLCRRSACCFNLGNKAPEGPPPSPNVMFSVSALMTKQHGEEATLADTSTARRLVPGRRRVYRVMFAGTFNEIHSIFWGLAFYRQIMMDQRHMPGDKYKLQQSLSGIADALFPSASV